MVFVTRCTGLPSWGLPPLALRFGCSTVSFLFGSSKRRHANHVGSNVVAINRSEPWVSEKLPMPSSFHTAHVPNATHIAGVSWSRFPIGITFISPTYIGRSMAGHGVAACLGASGAYLCSTVTIRVPTEGLVRSPKQRAVWYEAPNSGLLVFHRNGISLRPFPWQYAPYQTPKHQA
jgi:hypothetical protein